jgi:uncharacterized membrane protein YjjP (DUF1212 family)
MAAAVELAAMREFLVFLRRVSRALMECGCSSNRVELLTGALGESWGFEVETLAIPTGVWISVRSGEENLTELTRVRNWSVDLDRLARLNELVELIIAHRISLADANARLAREKATRPPYGVLATLLAGGLASPILIYHYGGTPLEVALGLPVGVLVQALSKYVFVREDRLGDFLAAAFVALYACLCHVFLPWIDVPRLIVGGLVILVPGLVLINAVHEVAQKNLVSGAAKLLEALMITASLGLGVIFVLGFTLLLA